MLASSCSLDAGTGDAMVGCLWVGEAVGFGRFLLGWRGDIRDGAKSTLSKIKYNFDIHPRGVVSVLVHSALQ
jgi:hypothetical protein